MDIALIAGAVVVVILLMLLFATVKVAREYERGVIFRLGRLLPEPKGPGLFLLIPFVDRMEKVELRTVTLNVPPQEVITKDNVPVRVNAVAYFRIVEPKAAIVQVENYMNATSQIAQTTLRSVLGQHVLDELLSERDKINAILQPIIDDATSPWGIKVSVVEVKDVEIPSDMQRAMARQAEAERERRAKVISAEGEFQASERLKDAAAVMAQEPITVQLRYLQTLLEIGSNNNSTIVFPIPIDLLTALSKLAGRGSRFRERLGLSPVRRSLLLVVVLDGARCRRRCRGTLARTCRPAGAPPAGVGGRLHELGVVVVRSDDRCQGRDVLALTQPRHDHTLRRAARALDPVDGHADHRARIGDEHHLVALAHDAGAGEASLALDELRGLDPHRAAALDRILGDAGALAPPVLGDDEQIGVVGGDVDLDHLVVAPELHAGDARGGTAHGAHVALVESDGLAETGHHQDVVVAVGEANADQLVALAHLESDDPVGLQRSVVLKERSLLDLHPSSWRRRGTSTPCHHGLGSPRGRARPGGTAAG